jgi:hypothetical protein
MKVDVSKLKYDDDRVKYLIVPLWHIKSRDLADYLEVDKDPAFEGFVREQVEIYLSGKEPDVAIQDAVMNVADLYVADGDLTLRAGDYIAFQRQYREIAGKRA